MDYQEPGTLRNVLVTGSSRGLGRSIAEAFGASRAHVIIHHRDNPEPARDAAAAIKRLGGTSSICRADMARPEDIKRMFNDLHAKPGTLHVLVNNAAITDDALLLRMSESRRRRVMATDLQAPAICSRLASEIMPEGGHIVNITSLSGMTGRGGQTAYATAKAAVVGLTKSLAAELGPAGICVNALSPGYLPTDMGRSNPEAMHRAQEESVLGCLGDPEEVAAFVVHLTETSRISGQLLCLDSRLWGQL